MCKNKTELYLNYEKIGDVKDYSFAERRSITPLYSVGFTMPILQVNGPTWCTLSVDTTNLVANFSVILNKIDEAAPIHIALADLETTHAYVTNMWMIKGNTDGDLQFSGTQYLKEELLWYKKIKLKAFW